MRGSWTKAAREILQCPTRVLSNIFRYRLAGIRSTGVVVGCYAPTLILPDPANVSRHYSLQKKGPMRPGLIYLTTCWSLKRGGSQLALGHVSYGNNTMVLDNISNRGLRFQKRLGERFDFSLARVSGASITGLNNLTGLRSTEDALSALTLGFEGLKRPGGLRVELMYLDASTPAQLDFDAGEVPDNENNTAIGVKLLVSSPEQRLQGTIEFGRSRFRTAQSDDLNVDDPDLAEELGAIVADSESTDSARHIDVSVDLLRDHPLSETLSATATLTLNHDRVDPLYRSTGASVAADIEQNGIVLTLQLGDVSLQLQANQSEDNLDDTPMILKNKTRQQSAALSVPLKTLFGSEDLSSSLWPGLSYSSIVSINSRPILPTRICPVSTRKSFCPIRSAPTTTSISIGRESAGPLPTTCLTRFRTTGRKGGNRPIARTGYTVLP